MPDLSVRGKLSLDGSEWDATMRQAGASVEEFGGILNGLKDLIGITFSVEMIREFSRQILDSAENIHKTSERLGISEQAVQSFGFALKIAGADAELLGTSLDHLASATENALAAGAGGEKLRNTFKELGVSLEALQSNSLEQNFRLIMEHMSQTAADAKTVAGMREIFGRGGSQLIPVAKNFDKAEKVGQKLSVDDSTIAANMDTLRILTIAGQDMMRRGLQIGAAANTVFHGIADPKDFLKGHLEKGIEENVMPAVTGILAPEKSPTSQASLAPAMPASETQEIEKRNALILKTAEVEERTAFSRLTTEEKIAKLKQDITNLEPATKSGTPVSVAQAQLSSAQLQEQLSGLEAQKPPKFTMKHGDSLTHIGNFLGAGKGASDAIPAIANKTNEILRGMASTLKEMQHNSSGMSGQRHVP